ncbi:unnamed protein product [Adineta ricciae]|uniref:Uncharacterized protein n=1 Tax=Adineta ricciae TaxID=249248 RepID=A0A814KCD2_ADIRI|nr:unnamed protein product [Adineta ricciae]CAF1133558.1 unnamed protein product [Adineta ricciae]
MLVTVTETVSYGSYPVARKRPTNSSLGTGSDLTTVSKNMIRVKESIGRVSEADGRIRGQIPITGNYWKATDLARSCRTVLIWANSYSINQKATHYSYEAILRTSTGSSAKWEKNSTSRSRYKNATTNCTCLRYNYIQGVRTYNEQNGSRSSSSTGVTVSSVDICTTQQSEERG